MPVPPAAAGSNVASMRGYTNITWGTEMFTQNFTSTGTYIVKSVREMQVEELIKIPQGSGLTAVTMQLIDGKQFSITVEDDTAIAPPYVGQVVTFQNMFNPNTAATLGNVPPFGAGTVATGSFLVINNDFSAARKEPDERIIVGQAFALISAINGGGNPNINT